MAFRAYISELRPLHWGKNLLVFAAMVFSGQMFDSNLLFKNIVGFAAFCLLSSVVYIFNDIRDVEQDRQHPTKRNRPIAAGIIRIPNAIAMAVIFLVASFTANLVVGGMAGLAIWAAYLAINVAYSLGAKHYAYIDLIILAGCYVLRIEYGAVISRTVISPYLFLTVFALAFYLGMGKRRNEIKIHGREYRKVLGDYTYEFLDKFMYLCCTLAVTFYSIWCITNDEANSDSLYVWTVPIVIIILMKYTADIEGGKCDGDPMEVIKKDKILLLLVLSFGLLLLWILYYRHVAG